MKTRLILVAALALVLAGCGGEKTDNTTSAEPVTVTLAQLVGDTGNYVDQTVEVTGTVDHVCRHGGKRMFITGDTADQRMKIESAEAIAAFDRELEGSAVRVRGIVRLTEMDAAYLDSWEAEARAGTAEHGEHGDPHAHEDHAHDDHAHAEHEHDHAEPAAGEETAEGECVEGAEGEVGSADLEQIAHLRQQLAESGEASLKFYHLDCVSYEEI